MERASPAIAQPARTKALNPRLMALDISERAIVVALFVQFAWTALHNFALTDQIASLMMVVTEALSLVFILIRAPAASLSQRPSDWLLGVAGTMAPLLAVPVDGHHALLPPAICMLPLLMGLFLQIAAKVALGRGFGIVAANRGVRTTGPYRFLRHPMYAGYTLAHVGILLALPSARNAALYAVALSLQILRIAREERVLMQDKDYRTFAAAVRYRLLPGVY